MHPQAPLQAALARLGIPSAVLACACTPRCALSAATCPCPPRPCISWPPTGRQGSGPNACVLEPVHTPCRSNVARRLTFPSSGSKAGSPPVEADTAQYDWVLAPALQMLPPPRPAVPVSAQRPIVIPDSPPSATVAQLPQVPPWGGLTYPAPCGVGGDVWCSKCARACNLWAVVLGSGGRGRVGGGCPPR